MALIFPGEGAETCYLKHEVLNVFSHHHLKASLFLTLATCHLDLRSLCAMVRICFLLLFTLLTSQIVVISRDYNSLYQKLQNRVQNTIKAILYISSQSINQIQQNKRSWGKIELQSSFFNTHFSRPVQSKGFPIHGELVLNQLKTNNLLTFSIQ